MVFFTCNACGQSIKKNKVEKHYQVECRSCEILSCMDCGKEFAGDEYLSHTSCISEAQKYQGALYSESNKGQPKGEKKQQEWLEVNYESYLENYAHRCLFLVSRGSAGRCRPWRRILGLLTCWKGLRIILTFHGRSLSSLYVHNRSGWSVNWWLTILYAHLPSLWLSSGRVSVLLDGYEIRFVEQ